MRRLRPLAATLALLLMVHLTLMSGAMACPMSGPSSDGPAGGALPHGRAGAVAHAAGMAGPMHHAAPPHGAPQHGAPLTSQGTHHDSPCSPVGCNAAGHCVPRGEAACRAPALERLVGAQRHAPARVDLPRSVSIAPEPPPPRA